MNGQWPPPDPSSPLFLSLPTGRGELPWSIGCMAHKLHLFSFPPSFLPLALVSRLAWPPSLPPPPSRCRRRHMPVENEIDEQRLLALLTPSRGPSDVNLARLNLAALSAPCCLCRPYLRQQLVVGLGNLGRLLRVLRLLLPLPR